MKHILCNIELKQRIENSKIEKKIISTGLDELDDALDGGFQGGNLYVLSGDVCTGKHALLQSILCNSIENGTNNIVYFSFCYDCYGVLQRLLHALARVSFLSEPADEDKWNKLVDAANKIVKSELCIHDSMGICVKELKETINNPICKNSQLLIIDDYHCIEGHQELRVNEYTDLCLEWEYVAGEIKKLAKWINVPILVISQTCKTSGSKYKENTSMDADPFIIEKEADTVIFMSRDECRNEKTEIDMMIYSNKSGENKTIKCAYFPEYRRIENIRKNN